MSGRNGGQASDRERLYRRQLGGAEAALRRERQKVRDLQELVRDLRDLVSDLREYACDEHDCASCRMHDARRGECSFLARMDELGVEI